MVVAAKWYSLTNEEKGAIRDMRRWLYRNHPELTPKQRRAVARGDMSLAELLEAKAAEPVSAEVF